MVIHGLVLRNSFHFLSLFVLFWGLCGCGGEKAGAIKELQDRGVEVSGLRLLRAAEEGDLEHLDLLLRAGVYAGQRDRLGRMPLHLAVIQRSPRMVKLLIDHGAGVHHETANGGTVVALALASGQSALAADLLKRGAKPDGFTPGGERLLPWAIREGRTEDIQLLLKAGADPHGRDESGTPLLHLAIAVKNKDLVRELIALGADCGAIDANGESTLVLALRNGWEDLTEPLVRAGADPNAADRDGVRPIIRALESGREGLARELGEVGAVVDKGYLDGALREAYLARDFSACRMWLRFGARPTVPRATCLVRRAAMDDETGFLNLFLGYTGVPDGMLYEHCRRGRNHVVGLLLAHGASVNPSRAPFLGTPFGRAIEEGGDAMALDLLGAGAHPRGLASMGAESLPLAIVSGRTETVRRLLEWGAPPNAELQGPHPEGFLKKVRGATMRWLLRKDQRITPIMLAVDSGSIATVRTLLEHGAESNVWTRRAAIWPINLAARHEDVRMMRLLLGKDPYVEERRVVVDLSDQELVVFGETGEEVFRTRISTGKKDYETPTGEFAITNRYRNWQSTIYRASMPYFQRLSCSDFGFHQGYVPGRPASHGCIRVPSGSASKLFQLTRLGDRVTIVP